MPRWNDDAVVLRRFDWSETSQIAWLFTREHGLVRGVAKGAKRPKSAFDGGLEPLTRGDLSAIVKPDADLATLVSWDLRDVCWPARTSLRANHAALFGVGLLASAVTDHDPHPPIFDALVALLEQIGSAPDPWGPVALFQWAVLVETGHAPSLERVEGLASAADVVGFEPHAGDFTPDPGTHAPSQWRVRAGTAAGIEELARAGRAPSGDDAHRLNRFFFSYWTWILGRKPRVGALLAQGETAQPRSRQA